MSLKIVHAGDFHIGASFSQLDTKLARQRGDEVRAALTAVVNFCREKAVDALLISGDLFDIPKPARADSEFVKNTLMSLSPTDVYIICGNHDYMCAQSPFSDPAYFSDNVHIFPCYEYSFEIPGKNTVIWGKSYSSDITEPSFSCCKFDKNKINIMLLHGDVTAGSDFNIISKDTLSSLPCNYAAFGHIHAGGIFNVGNVKCAYSGAAEGHSFNDCGLTGIIYAEISENETSLTHVDTSLRKYRHIEIDITGKGERDIIDEAQSLINGTDFFRLTLTGEYSENSSPDLSFIMNQLEKNAFYIDITDSSFPGYDLDTIEKEESLRGAFLRELKQSAGSQEEFSAAAKIGLDALGGRLGGTL